MQTFIDSVTNKIYAFEDDVKAVETNGVYSFSTPNGLPITSVPTTLQPYTIPEPTAAQLLEQSQASQSASLRRSYQQAISTCPITINGTAYTLALDSANATLNFSAALSAQQALASPAWTADADVTLGQLCTVSGVPLFCSTAGKTGSTAPTVPSAIGTPVSDGTAEWELFARSAEYTNGTFAWFTAAEIVQVGQQIELFLHQQKSTLIGLLAEVQAQTAVPSSPVTWP